MKLEEKNIIVERPYKTVYRCDDSIVKVFAETHPKADIFNEALVNGRSRLNIKTERRWKR